MPTPTEVMGEHVARGGYERGVMVVRRSDVLVPLDRNPSEVFLLALCLVTGLAGLGAPPPPHVNEGFAIAWNLLLAASGLAGLIGIVWRDALAGLLITRAAMIPAGFGAYGYAVILGVATLRESVLQAIFSYTVVVGFGVALHWRVVQITRYLRTQPGRHR